MRSKLEFEARVRELAAQKKEAERIKQRKIRNFTIAGGVFVCAACCVLVFTKIGMEMNMIKNSSDKMSGENSFPEDFGDYTMPENATETGKTQNSNNGLLNQPEDTLTMENDIGKNESADAEDGIVNISSVSIMCTDNNEGTSRAVLLGGENESAGRLIEWIEGLDYTEPSDAVTVIPDISYEIRLYSGEDYNIVIIENGCIKSEGIWYSFSEEENAVLEAILSECFER